MRDRLRKNPAASPAEELAALEKALKGQGPKQSLTVRSETNSAPKPIASRKREISPGIALQAEGDRLVLSGSGVTDGFRAELEAWLSRR